MTRRGSRGECATNARMGVKSGWPVAALTVVGVVLFVFGNP